MKLTLYPSKLHGVVKAPASKSSMQRACAAAYLSKRICHLYNPGHSNDDKASLEIIKNLGAGVQVLDDEVVVAPGMGEVKGEIHCGESGLSIRMFTPIATLMDSKITINGSGSLVNRPMDLFDEILPPLGVQIQSNQGKLPITVQGPLKPKNIEVDGSLSSQFLTGLLMAFSASGARGVSIKVRNLKSRPYISLTLDVMKQFGMQVPENRNFEEFFFPETTAPVSNSSPVRYTVEGDWSGGAFLLVAGAIAGPITIEGLDITSTQADRVITDAMIQAQVSLSMGTDGIQVQPGKWRAFEFDATDCPDLFPPLVALAAYCNGITKIRGVNRLTHKESNRAVALQDEFDKMGVTIDLEDDIMIIQGGKGVKGADVHSHHDHRIAMACAVAALKARDETVIEEAEAVDKSYPDFYSDLNKLGAKIESEFVPPTP